jgi:hypothetical protein
VRARLLVLLLALVAAGCASTVDRIVSRVGGPQRGFLTPPALRDSGPAVASGCTAAGCAQAPAFCTARGYLRGTDGYNRCIVSVEQSFRRR